jgi:hypothetical protein
MAAMMGGRSGITSWMIGDVATEDKDEEGLASTEGVVHGLEVGDRTLGVRGCKMVGSKIISVTKLSDLVLTRLCSERVSKSGFRKVTSSPKKERNLCKGV